MRAHVCVCVCASSLFPLNLATKLNAHRCVNLFRVHWQTWLWRTHTRAFARCLSATRQWRSRRSTKAWCAMRGFQRSARTCHTTFTQQILHIRSSHAHAHALTYTHAHRYARVMVNEIVDDMIAHVSRLTGGAKEYFIPILYLKMVDADSATTTPTANDGERPHVDISRATQCRTPRLRIVHHHVGLRTPTRRQIQDPGDGAAIERIRHHGY